MIFYTTNLKGTSTDYSKVIHELVTKGKTDNIPEAFSSRWGFKRSDKWRGLDGKYTNDGVSR